MVGESQEAVVGAGAGSGSGSNKTPTLEEYGTNLTAQATEVTLCSFFGFMRSHTLRSAIHVVQGFPSFPWLGERSCWL